MPRQTGPHPNIQYLHSCFRLVHSEQTYDDKKKVLCLNFGHFYVHLFDCFTAGLVVASVTTQDTTTPSSTTSNKLGTGNLTVGSDYNASSPVTPSNAIANISTATTDITSISSNTSTMNITNTNGTIAPSITKRTGESYYFNYLLPHARSHKCWITILSEILTLMTSPLITMSSLFYDFFCPHQFLLVE